MMIESTFRPWKIIGLFKPDYVNTRSLKKNMKCIKRESNPRRVDGNDPGYHYPINAIL